MTTIVLADDHHIVRRGLRALLEAEPDFRVIGEAGDGLEAVQLVERLRPEVLVLDMRMPVLSGLVVVHRVRRRSPETRVVILSMYGEEPYVMEALRLGAQAYVLKESSPDELARAIREVVAGRRYLGTSLQERAIETYVRNAGSDEPNAYQTLTLREQEVLYLAAEGLTNVEIADRLVISPRTVETHRANLMRKLGLRNQTDLIRFALRQGILPIEN